MLEIKKTQDGKNVAMELIGRLDTTTAPQLEAEKANFAGIESLVLDFANLEYLSSAGLRVLLQFQKNKEIKMEVKNVSDEIMEIFDMTGFSSILTII